MAAEGVAFSKREKARLAVRDFVYSYIPITYWLPRYHFKEYFSNDLLGGMTIASLHIAQGMAFAMLADVEPIMGLYTSCFPVFIYCVFGTAVKSSFGTVSVTSLLVGETILELGPVDYSNEDIVQVITFVVGVVYLGIFFICYHVIVKLFTKYMTSSFLIGCAMHVIITSFKLLLGLKVKYYGGNFSILYNSYNTFKVITETNLITLGISLFILTLFAINTFIIIPQMKKVTPIVLPMELILLIVFIVLSYTLKFERFNIDLLGDVPTGLPAPSIPDFNVAKFIWLDAIALAIVNFATTLTLILMLDPEARLNQELFALAMSHLTCCYFKVFPIGNSMMRTMVAMSCGKRTLLSDIFSSVFVLMAIAFMGPIFSPLPLCFLGCVIVYGLSMLIVNEFRKIPEMFSNGWENAAIWVVTGLVTLFIAIQYGLIVGLILTLRQYLAYEEPFKKKEASGNNENQPAERK